MLSILSNLNTTSPAIEASALITRDGLIIASTFPETFNQDHLGALTAALFTIGKDTSQLFIGENLEKVSILGEQGRVFVAPVNNDIALTILTNDQQHCEKLYEQITKSIQQILAAI